MNNSLKASKTGLFSKFVSNSVATNLTTIILILAGFLAISSMKREVFPAISQNVVNVSVAAPGFTPFEVEESITRRIEGAVLGLDGVKRVQSTSANNSSSVRIELADFADQITVRDSVESAVNQLQNFPPQNAERPIISLPKATGEVITLVLSGDLSPLELRRAAEIVERDLLSTSGVSLVALSGDKDYEVAIEITESTLQRYDLTFDEIASKVRAASVDLAGGEITTTSEQISLRVNQKMQSAEEFGDIIIRNDSLGARILLKDIAIIKEGFADGELTNLYNDKPAIFIQVSRAEGEDVLTVRDAVGRFIETYKAPEGLVIEEFKDQSKILKERFSLLSKNAIFGFVLVFGFLVLMLDLKLAFWISVGIATAFMGGFLILSLLGVSLTMITMFGLIIVLGLVVDDAIVIGEKVNYFRQTTDDGIKAATMGVSSVRAPVFVGVLTTIAAFSPLLFVDGTFGEITRAIPVVIISVLIVSLFEAFYILPAHLSRGGNWSTGSLAALQSKIANGITKLVDTIVEPVVEFAVKRRVITLLATTGFIIASISLVASGNVRFIFFPSIEGNEMSVTVTMPEGTPYAGTEAVVANLERSLRKVAIDIKEETGEDLIKSLAVTIGGQGSRGSGPVAANAFTAKENIGQIQVELVPFGTRKMSAVGLEKRWRDAVTNVPAEARLRYTSSIASFGSDLEFELSHFEPEVLDAAALELKNIMMTTPGVFGVEDNNDTGRKQFLFELNEVGKSLGLKAEDIARQVRQSYFGQEVQRLQRGREEVKVFLKYPAHERQTLDSLNRLQIWLEPSVSVPLNSVTNITEMRSPLAITRIDGRRVVRVSADVDESVTTPSLASEAFLTQVLPQLTDRFPGLVWEEAGASREQAEDGANLMNAFYIVLLIIYGILATQLRSYIQPLVILMSIPIGLAGAILGHYVLGFDLSFVSLFGVVALSGVAVNSAVVLVDQYNKNKAEGIAVQRAAVLSSLSRFRPVLLTTLTTAFGLMPLLFETSPQAQFLIPMAVSLGFGILISGFLVLLSTPALCTMMDRKEI